MRSRRNVLPALGCSRFFSSCVFLHCHSAAPSAVKRWKKQLTEEHPQGNTSSAMLARRLFSKHLLGFILLQLGQPAAKGHIQSDVDVLRKTSAAGMQPACTSPSSSRFSMCCFTLIRFRMNVAFGLFSRGQQLTFVRTKTKQCGATACLPVLHSTAPSRQRLPGQGCAVCRKFISRPLGRCGAMMIFRLPRVWGVILYCGLISFSSRSACPHLSII